MKAVAVFPQMFSTEEKRAAQQHKVTVHGAPGPEPFTVINVREHVTTKQLLTMVSTSANINQPHTGAQINGCSLLQLVPDSFSDHILVEEKIPSSKEKNDAKKVSQQRPLVSDEKVLRAVNAWQPEEGYVGRLLLKTKEEVKNLIVTLKWCRVTRSRIIAGTSYMSHFLNQSLFFMNFLRFNIVAEY